MERNEGEMEEPALLAYLAFLDQEIARDPDLVQPIDELLAPGEELVRGIDVDLDEDLGNVSLP